MNPASQHIYLKKQIREPFFWMCTISTIILWVFVWVHAWQMDITNDEAYSFFLVKMHRYRGMPGTANTHWLNSFFIFIWSHLFGDHPLSLRLHSVLAFPFFAWAIYRLALFIKNIPAQVLFFGLLVVNPYVLDFFSLSRGYAMAITFQASCCWYFIQALQQPAFSYRLWWRVVLLAAFTLAANLSYLYTVLGIACAFFVANGSFLQLRSFLTNKKRLQILLLFSFIIVFAIADLLFIRIHGKDLEYGGDTDFLRSIFGTVWQGSLYFSHSYLLNLLSYGSFLLIVATCFFHILQSIRQKSLTTGLLLCIPIVVILLLNLSFHLFFGTPYLMARTALQWLIPGLFILFYTIGTLLPSTLFTIPVTACSLLVAGILATHFIRTSNSAMCYEWFSQANTRQPLYDIYPYNPTSPQLSIVLEGPFRNYYQVVDQKFRQLEPSILAENSEERTCNQQLYQQLSGADYSLVYLPLTLHCMKEWNLAYTIIKTYPGTSLTLVKINRATAIQPENNAR